MLELYLRSSTSVSKSTPQKGQNLTFFDIEKNPGGQFTELPIIPSHLGHLVAKKTNASTTIKTKTAGTDSIAKLG